MKLLSSGLTVMLGAGLVACSPASSSKPDAIRIRWARDPANLDPLVVDNLSSYTVANLLHCSLLKPNEKKLISVPWLAEAYPTVRSLNDSLMLVSFRLRPEATWDNGSPVLARDVAFTLKVMNCPGLPIELDQAQYGFIRDIELDAQDPRRFTLLCAGKSSEYVQQSGDFSILPEYVLDPQGQLRPLTIASMRRPGAAAGVVASFARRYQALELARHPERLPGCGPYQLRSWQPGRYLTLQRKTTWWADRLPAVPPQLQAVPRRITYHVIPDAATATLALRRGEIDLYSMMPAGEFVRLQESASDRARLRFYTTPSYECLIASFNVRQPVLRDRLTRQALSQLFNIPALIQAVERGTAYPTVGLISPAIKAYYNDSLPLPQYSPAQAVELLQQAGWQRLPAGGWQRPVAGGAPRRLQLSISYRAGEPSFETVALQFRAAAAAIGIRVELRPLEGALLSQQLRAGTTDITLRNIAGSPFSYDFTSFLHSEGLGVGNFTGYATPASDKLIKDIAQAEQPDQKARLLRRLQRLLHEEKPLLVLYYMQYRIAAASTLGPIPVMGFKPGYDVQRIGAVPAGTP
ncbi:ABC transporter substrate-binding protein [Hymenobacter weizhouensis]|uniref:ABC transporter substrate-binding protein n=1 Tax=Hymenobacter sp. YIM 151500-1 TaxID=2987689 RepID=UPI00222807F9|nr:ABC transporter substrate-binding protein [Hymenobacter sp. YIM 151500-1]UYZ63045.1 ABC transporter substrate-binding protein [Hymenobacter sp. YIM 151500-1]